MDLAQFKENVALLAVLSEVSGYEDGNAQVDVSTPRQDTSPRRLSLKQESDLVDDLAFISATSEEPEHVIAVCIEEHRDSKGLTIRLARNKGDLQETKHALKEITSVLEKVAARGCACNLCRNTELTSLRDRPGCGQGDHQEQDPWNESQPYSMPASFKTRKTIVPQNGKTSMDPTDPRSSRQGGKTWALEGRPSIYLETDVLSCEGTRDLFPEIGGSRQY